MSVGPKDLYPQRAFVQVLPGIKKLEMEMPVNAFWRNFGKATLLPMRVAAKTLWVSQWSLLAQNDLQFWHFALHRWTDCESNQTVFFFFLRAETPLGAEYKAINQIYPSTRPQVGILMNHFVPGVEKLNFFEENAKFPPPSPLSALHILERVSPHNHLNIFLLINS